MHYSIFEQINRSAWITAAPQDFSHERLFLLFPFLFGGSDFFSGRASDSAEKSRLTLLPVVVCQASKSLVGGIPEPYPRPSFSKEILTDACQVSDD